MAQPVELSPAKSFLFFFISFAVKITKICSGSNAFFTLNGILNPVSSLLLPPLPLHSFSKTCHESQKYMQF